MNCLVPHPTWEIHDASKIQAYMECPRKYFYRYILGWETESDNVHLIFGEAWHRAMEYILLYGKGQEAIRDAYLRLEAYYREYFPDPLTDETRGNKTPGKALNGLVEYCNYYKSDDFEVIETEVAGTIPINPIDLSERLHFRIDAVCKDSSGYFILEHKTASRESEAWKDQWSLSMQISLYTHVLFCLYPYKEVWGTRVNGVVFRKHDRGFVRVPVRKTPAGLTNWMMQTQIWHKMIKEDIQSVIKEDDSKLSMTSFLMNTQNCTKYKTCPYHDLCMSWNNPLRRCGEGCPMGFKVSWWNPANREKEVAKRIVDL